MNQLVTEARALCQGATKGPWIAPTYICEADAELMKRSRTLIPEMADEIERLQAERDRFKARAEAAERDIRQMLRSDEACDLCVFCKCFCDEYCACSTGAEWRGPQEGANQ
jgi:hypothetical protein